MKAFGFEITDGTYKVIAPGHVCKDNVYIGMLSTSDTDVFIRTDLGPVYFIHQLIQVMHDKGMDTVLEYQH